MLTTDAQVQAAAMAAEAAAAGAAAAGAAAASAPFSVQAAVSSSPHTLERTCGSCSDAAKGALGTAKSALFAYAAATRVATAKKTAQAAQDAVDERKRLEGNVAKAQAAYSSLKHRPCRVAHQVFYTGDPRVLTLAVQRGLLFTGTEGDAVALKSDAPIDSAFLNTGVTVYDPAGTTPLIFSLAAFGCHDGSVGGGHYTGHALTKAFEPEWPLGTVSLDDRETRVAEGNVAAFHAKFTQLSRSAYVLFLVRKDLLDTALATVTVAAAEMDES